MFIQPDWFEVTQAGVGTNRYAYSFNDPVNLRDPNGNLACGGVCIVGAIIGAIIGGAKPVNSPGPDDKVVSQSDGRTLVNSGVGALGGAIAGTVLKRAATACLNGGLGCKTEPKQPNVDDQGSIVPPRDTQIASPYPQDRIVGGKGEGRRVTDPKVGDVESDSWELTQENIKRMEEGRAPIGVDGQSIEIHHRDQNPKGPLDEMTATSHRGVDHPLRPSRINRSKFSGERKRYWRERIRKIMGQ